jgi:hypothetical protein
MVQPEPISRNESIALATTTNEPLQAAANTYINPHGM